MPSSFHHLFIFSVILLVSWSVPQVEPRLPLRSSMADRYKLWMAEYNKVYPTDTELQKRFRIFEENVKYIDSFNAAANKTYTLGVNQFTDLTSDERVARFTGYQPPEVWNASANFKYESISLAELPRSWDWREKGAVTPVKSQTCGNCWLFAGVAEVESVNLIAGNKKIVPLSEQEIMDCDDLPGKGGCQGGWVQEVYEYVKHYSLTTEAHYPNQPEAQTCDASKKAGGRFARVRDFVNMPSYISDEELMKVVAKHPVAVGVDVSSPDFGSYKSGVFTGKCDIKLNHALVIVGYGESDGLKYWIARNSWGEGWGDGGYIKMQRGTGRREGLCGINLTPSYPIA